MSNQPTLNELESFFKDLKVEYEVVLPTGEVVTDINRLATTHISYCKNNPKNKGYLPYYKRLLTVYKICS